MNAWGRFSMVTLLLGVVSPSLGFEKVALVDSFDFSRYFDCETFTGTVSIADHCLKVGANALWWRSRGGGKLRYPSETDCPPAAERPFCKLVTADTRNVLGWMRLNKGEGDLLRCALDHLVAKGVPAGIHYTNEENHFFRSTFNAWNCGHPQYCVRTRRGTPWLGCASLSFPEVLKRKLKMVDEQLAYGPKTFFLDLWRSGGWDVGLEYVPTLVSAWRKIYPDEPLPDSSDERWIALVAENQNAYYRGIRHLIEKHGGRTRFALGIPYVDEVDEWAWKTYAVDWKRLAADGTVDDVVVMSVCPDKRKERVWPSVRRIYDYVMAHRGKAGVYFPCSMYDYHPGIPSLMKWTGETRARCAEQLLELATEVGAKGVILECVDYRNYPEDVCEVIRHFVPRTTENLTIERNADGHE